MKKWGHRARLRVSRLLKCFFFDWLCVKNPNHLHTEISLGYLKDTIFYLESKASFIRISSIASLKPFLIAWLWEYCRLWEYCTFSVSSVVSLKSSSWPKYTQYGTIFQKKSCSTNKLFFFFKYVPYLTALSKYLKKSRGSPCSSKRKEAFISLSSLV